MSNDDIQTLIDQVAPGGVLKLTPAKTEFQGPAVIRTPMTIEGNGCTLWAETGPVLSVECDRVSISKLNIECTGPDEQQGTAACAVNVKDQHKVALNDVAVRGNIIGVEKEEGEWRYPRSIRLGRLQPDQPHNFTAKFVVPTPCEFTSEIAGLSVQPKKSKGGAVKLLLVIDPLKAGTILRGVITIRTGALTRTINVNANAPTHILGTETVGSGQDVYAPDDWQTMYADDDAADAPQASPSPKQPKKQPPPPPKPAPSVSIPPPPGQQKEKKKKEKGPTVNLPDRIESTPATQKKPKQKDAFDPPEPEAPSKPLPDEPVPTSSSRKRSTRIRRDMDSSLFGSKPKGEDSTQTEKKDSGESEVSQTPPSIVPPPPPKKSKPPEKKSAPTQSVVPPPPPKSNSGAKETKPTKETKSPEPAQKKDSSQSKDQGDSKRRKNSGLGGAFG